MSAGAASQRGGDARVRRSQHDHTRPAVPTVHPERPPPPRDEAHHQRGPPGRDRPRASGCGRGSRRPSDHIIRLAAAAVSTPGIHWERQPLPPRVSAPQRVYDRDRRPWDRISAAAADALALCHNDIGPQNIFVCPDTFRIVAIIDWEVAGLFPPYFELPLWRVFDWGDEQKAVRRGECARAWVFWAQGRGFGRLSPTAVMNTSRNPTTGNGRDMVVACMCRLSSVLARIRA